MSPPENATPDYGQWIGRSMSVQDILIPSAVQIWSATLDNSGNQDVLGDEAPQGVHWILCPPTEPMSELGPDGHPEKGGFLPPIPYPRRMWAASSVRFLAPLHIGDTVRKTSTIAAITPKAGKTGKLVFLEVDHIYSVNDVDCISERQTIVYRHMGDRPSKVPQPDPLPKDLPKHGLPEGRWIWHRDVLTDPVLMFRWSAFTFNAHRIHYDLPYATEVEGYPGLVVQGPLIATLLLDLCSRNLEGKVLKTFAFRAINPAFCGETLAFLGQQSKTGLSLCAASHETGTKMQATATVADTTAG